MPRALQVLILAVVLMFGVAVCAQSGRQEWPASGTEKLAIRAWQERVKALEDQRRVLEAEAQVLFDEAATVRSLSTTQRQRFRFDAQAGVFYLIAEVAAVASH